MRIDQLLDLAEKALLGLLIGGVSFLAGVLAVAVIAGISALFALPVVLLLHLIRLL